MCIVVLCCCRWCVCLWKSIEGVIAVGNNAILVRTVGVLQLEIKTLHRCGFSSISDQYYINPCVVISNFSIQQKKNHKLICDRRITFTDLTMSLHIIVCLTQVNCQDWWNFEQKKQCNINASFKSFLP